MPDRTATTGLASHKDGDDTVLVVVGELLTGEVESSIDRNGEVEALQTVELYPFSEGIVADVFVDVGDVVKAGQPLLQLDTAVLKLAEESAANLYQEAQTAQELAAIDLDEAIDQEKTSRARAEQTERECQDAEAVHCG